MKLMRFMLVVSLAKRIYTWKEKPTITLTSAVVELQKRLLSVLRNVIQDEYMLL